MTCQPETLESFILTFPSAIDEGGETLFFEAVTTHQITSFSDVKQQQLRREISLLFSVIFTDKKDWEYMVRHFFYHPKGNTVRQAIFVRDTTGRLISLCAFDHGIFMVDNMELSLIYIHIRAVLSGFRKYGIGRIFSERILKILKPDILMTTCVQLASLYSWIKIKSPEIIKEYDCFPRTEIISGVEKAIPLPYDQIDFILKCFKFIYTSHVKENQTELNNVVNNITIHLVRKGVTASFDYLKWHEKGQKSKIAEELGVTETDSILLVIKKKSFLALYRRGTEGLG